ncbi:hypothetical protein R1sor_001303 [Riccia sorocarpa]|uniref:Uncharacterized protein n=1 Tax=Riccia sorocarpa TaxID=122646 RepID=A0ABD3GXJ0_9MARC
METDELTISFSVDEGFQGLSINSRDDRTGEEVENGSHEKKSVISKVKGKMSKAKEKLKTKIKSRKRTEAGDEETEDNDDAEVDPTSLLETSPPGFEADGAYVNHGKPPESFGVKQSSKDHGYPQSRKNVDSSQESNKHDSGGLISVPTDYSSPRASVDAIMPPPIINPGPASDLGEISASNLGEIPEKPKEEEKVVNEASGHDELRSSPSFGSFGDTTQNKLSLSNHQKEEMEPLERDSMSQELGDKSKGIKFTESGSFMDASQKKSSRPEVDSDRKEDLEPLERNSMSQAIGEDSRETKFSKAPSGGVIEKHVTEEKQDSFTQKVYESESDEESASTREAGEGDVATKGSEAKRPLRDPDVELPVPGGAEFKESMFSSVDADNLRDVKSSDGTRESVEFNDSGVSDRDLNEEEHNLTPSNTRTDIVLGEQGEEVSKPAGEQEQFPDPEVDESSWKKQKSDVSVGERDQFHDPELDESSLKKQKSGVSVGEQEQFRDPELDESNLEKETPRAADTDSKRHEKGVSVADDDLESDEKEEQNGKGTGIWSSATTALGSVLGAVVSKAGIYPSDENNASEATPAADDDDEGLAEGKTWNMWKGEDTRHRLPPITPQNSTVESLDAEGSSPPQSWISKAVGALYGQSNKKEENIEEGNEEEDDDVPYRR